MKALFTAIGLSLSFLSFAIGVHLLRGPEALHADTLVDHNAGGIVGLRVNWEPSRGYAGWNGYLLMADGQVLAYSGNPTGEPFSASNLDPIPVPVSEIKIWGWRTLVTTSNEIWVVPPNETSWVSIGTPPELPVSSDGSSVGELKGRY